MVWFDGISVHEFTINEGSVMWSSGIDQIRLYNASTGNVSGKRVGHASESATIVSHTNPAFLELQYLGQTSYDQVYIVK